jgi:hypothetical protein
MTSAMATRTVLHVVPEVNGWEVRREGSDETIVLVDNKDNALGQARELAKASMPSQVIVHTRDGRFEEEFTYGDDPRDIPG